jgi:lantibiotic biosynthesis protein
MSVASYLLRWQRRVTPFGLFAGVMPATIGLAEAAIETKHRAVARADADWITVLADDLDRDPCLRPRLAVIASNLAVVRDGRLTVSCRAAPGSAMPGPVREASVRWTRPVQAAIELAATPIEVAALAGKLASRFTRGAG